MLGFCPVKSQIANRLCFWYDRQISVFFFSGEVGHLLHLRPHRLVYLTFSQLQWFSLEFWLFFYCFRALLLYDCIGSVFYVGFLLCFLSFLDVIDFGGFELFFLPGTHFRIRTVGFGIFNFEKVVFVEEIVKDRLLSFHSNKHIYNLIWIKIYIFKISFIASLVLRIYVTELVYASDKHLWRLLLTCFLLLIVLILILVVRPK